MATARLGRMTWKNDLQIGFPAWVITLLEWAAICEKSGSAQSTDLRDSTMLIRRSRKTMAKLTKAEKTRVRAAAMA